MRPNAVTTFTASDFGRTYVSNGNGSDHGWASQSFCHERSTRRVGRLHGHFPNLTIDGPEDTGQGRYIPTNSVDEYAFEMARWLGVPLSEMRTVFPNIGRLPRREQPRDAHGDFGVAARATRPALRCRLVFLAIPRWASLRRPSRGGRYGAVDVARVCGLLAGAALASCFRNTASSVLCSKCAFDNRQ